MAKQEIRKMVRGGQVTLPKWFRDKNHLEEGDPIEFSEENGALILKPLRVAASENPVTKLVKFLDKAKDTDAEENEDVLLAHVQSARLK